MMRALRLLLLCLLLAPAALAAQVGVTTDILRGRVLDAQGNPVPNARVEAVSAETNVRRATVAGADGRYTLTFPEGGGRYTVRASA
ncbi:MAG TPA: carboxypeptidase-like regulatory domain-containing protein, partial [Longimicrobiaceae bacterium]|nr:carboxypeptidase-like regulatory domain-containing protein [Longimicrobiaceae bacterium]